MNGRYGRLGSTTRIASVTWGAREDEADVRVPKVAGGLSELAVAK